MEVMETVRIGVIERPIPEQGQRAPHRGFLIGLCDRKHSTREASIFWSHAPHEQQQCLPSTASRPSSVPIGIVVRSAIKPSIHWRASTLNVRLSEPSLWNQRAGGSRYPRLVAPPLW